MDPLRIGISIGDVNGIGPEVVVKALSRPGVLDLVTPVIYATPQVLKDYRGEEDRAFNYEIIKNAEAAEDGRINLVEAWEGDLELNPGQPTEAGGRAAAKSLERAVADLKEENIDALVTAPINKSVMPKDDFPIPDTRRCSPRNWRSGKA
jgi:4-hydroxy-L-threonine phosphate dehydrogenase PdxA